MRNEDVGAVARWRWSSVTTFNDNTALPPPAEFDPAFLAPVAEHVTKFLDNLLQAGAIVVVVVDGVTRGQLKRCLVGDAVTC